MKRSFEQRLFIYMVAFVALCCVLIVGHWWMDALGEDAAWVWLCNSMGNRECGPGEPWIVWQPGGSD